LILEFDDDVAQALQAESLRTGETIDQIVNRVLAAQLQKEAQV
jgi:hypothetical protein